MGTHQWFHMKLWRNTKLKLWFWHDSKLDIYWHTIINYNNPRMPLQIYFTMKRSTMGKIKSQERVCSHAWQATSLHGGDEPLNGCLWNPSPLSCNATSNWRIFYYLWPQTSHIVPQMLDWWDIRREGWRVQHYHIGLVKMPWGHAICVRAVWNVSRTSWYMRIHVTFPHIVPVVSGMHSISTHVQLCPVMAVNTSPNHYTSFSPTHNAVIVVLFTTAMPHSHHFVSVSHVGLYSGFIR